MIHDVQKTALSSVHFLWKIDFAVIMDWILIYSNPWSSHVFLPVLHAQPSCMLLHWFQIFLLLLSPLDNTLPNQWFIMVKIDHRY